MPAHDEIGRSNCGTWHQLRNVRTTLQEGRRGTNDFNNYHLVHVGIISGALVLKKVESTKLLCSCFTKEFGAV